MPDVPDPLPPTRSRYAPGATSEPEIASDPATPLTAVTRVTPDRVTPVRPDELPTIPGYTVTHEIARGGMGRVLAARDLTLNRDVAVKVLLAGPNARADGRFVREAGITARLPHPGIPPIYALGTLPDGGPFLAMKLVRGETLAERLEKRSDPAADLPRFVGVFEQVCQAVGFAHSQGVIHRDLKPANVMVGAFGEVQVMDWGLAKETADSHAPSPPADPSGAGGDGGGRSAVATLGLSDPPDPDATRPGAVLGTPAYMAPEQARGEPADARADVFALGAILLEILTCDRPYGRTYVQIILARATEERLDEAWRLLDGCGAEAELVGIARRCLAPKAAARPADAGAVAGLVAAYRAGVEDRLRKAEAQRAAAIARAVEQQKRRKVQAALAASVALLVLAGGGFAWWRDHQATARETERLQLDGDRKAAEARADTEREFKGRQARQGIDANRKLEAALRRQYRFKEADAALVQALELAEGGAPERIEEVTAVRRDLAFVVKLDGIRFRKWVWVADGGGKGDFNTKIAAPEYRAAFAGYGLDLVAMTASDAARRVTASTVRAEVVAAVDDWALYEPDAAVRNQLLEVARRADPGPWLDRLRAPELRGDKAALEKLAAEADPKHRAPAALAALAVLMQRQNLDPSAVLTAARAEHPPEFELAFALGQWHAAHSNDGQQIGPYEAARALRPENVVVWNNLGSALRVKKDLDGAVAAYRRAIQLDPTVAAAHTGLGSALGDKKDLNGAVAACRQAIELDPTDALAHTGLGVALQAKGDPDGAVVAYRRAIELDPTDAKAHYNRGLALGDKKDFAGAVAAWRRATELDPTNATAHYNLGVVLRAKGDLAGAVRAYRRAVELDPKHATAHTNLGGVYFGQKKYADAIASARAAIEVNPKYSNAHAILGAALQQTGDIAGARAALTEAARLDTRWAGFLAKLPPVPIAPPPRAVAR